MSSLPVPSRAQLAALPVESSRESDLELVVTGMTCAACAARVERSLGRIEGVDASVNSATERAAVRFDAGTTSVQDLIDAVRWAGYDAAHVIPVTTNSKSDSRDDSTGKAAS